VSEAALLPLFPLGTVLFPGVALPLHIFEDRYRQMVEVCLAGDRSFGIALIRRGWEVGPAAEPFDVGTAVRIARVERVDDGKFDLIVVGTSRFRIRRIVEGEPYLRADAEVLTEDTVDVEPALIGAVRRKYVEYVEIVRGLSRQANRPADAPEGAVELSYTVAANLQIGRGEQQTLLEATTAHRLDRERQILAREIALVRQLGAVVTRRSRSPADSPVN
jgi:Lon protease-like protein